jgi:hypothetical protein
MAALSYIIFSFVGCRTACGVAVGQLGWAGLAGPIPVWLDRSNGNAQGRVSARPPMRPGHPFRLLPHSFALQLCCLLPQMLPSSCAAHAMAMVPEGWAEARLRVCTFAHFGRGRLVSRGTGLQASPGGRAPPNTAPCPQNPPVPRKCASENQETSKFGTSVPLGRGGPGRTCCGARPTRLLPRAALPTFLSAPHVAGLAQREALVGGAG